MLSRLALILVGALLFGVSSVLGKQYCKRGQPCWPTQAEIEGLTASFDPTAKRSLWWQGLPHPRISGVPLNSPGDQPLYGAGIALKPVYTETEADRAGTCFLPAENPFSPMYCLISARGSPYEGYTPAFVVWPLTAAHVVTAVKFAISHNLWFVLCDAPLHLLVL